MPFLYLFTGHRYTICKPTETCHLVLLHVCKHEYICYSVTLIKPLEDPHTKSPDWLQWWIQGKGPLPLNFRPNWGPKKFFWDHMPPYLRVWMTPPPLPPPYLKVWICPWIDLHSFHTSVCQKIKLCSLWWSFY